MATSSVNLAPTVPEYPVKYLYAKLTLVMVLLGARLRINSADVFVFKEPDRKYVGFQPSIWQPSKFACSKDSRVNVEVVAASKRGVGGGEASVKQEGEAI